jgi:hypothetical protein
MKKIETTTNYTCDLCGANIVDEPIKQISVTMGYSMDLVYRAVFGIRFDVPYITTDGDLCNACFKQAVTELYEKVMRVM